MKYLNFFKIAPVALAIFAFSACDKVEAPEPMGDAGQTIVKFTAGYQLINVDYLPTPQTLAIFDLRRDIPNNAELNKTMTIIVKEDPGAVTAYDPTLLPMPAGSLVFDPSVPKVGSNYTLTMKPGDFAKVLKATLTNATLLSLTSKYAVGFTIVSCDANGKITSAPKTIVTEIGAKNQWDGKYMMSGTFIDITNPAFTYYGDQQYSLITSGPDRCVVRNDDLNGGGMGYIFSNAGAGTYYGQYGLEISFSGNTVSNLWNYYGNPLNPPSLGQNPNTGAGSGPPLYEGTNSRRAILDPTGANVVLANKNIVIKHIMTHRTVVTTAPHYRAFFDETWKYLGPR